MRQFIRENGQVRTVVLLSLLSVVLSMIFTGFITVALDSFGVDINFQAGILISFIVAMIIAPAMIWIMVSLFLKVDQLETEMRQLATYDSLTGLLTRREFLDRANYFHKIALREGLKFSLIIADLDNFKEVNDQFGHLTGDQTLETFGRAILDDLRDSDLACRFGGDEFLFFLPNATRDQAQQFGERLLDIIAEAFDYSGLEMKMSISLGIACFPDTPAENIKDMIAAADIALYQAKRSGGNQILHYNLANTS